MLITGVSLLNHYVQSGRRNSEIAAAAIKLCMYFLCKQFEDIMYTSYTIYRYLFRYQSKDADTSCLYWNC